MLTTIHQEHKEAEMLYQTIFETSNIPIALLDNTMVIYLVNAKFEQFCTYAKAEIEHKKNWQEFVAKDDWEKVKECHSRRADGTSVGYRSYDFRFIDKKGETKDVRANLSILPGTSKRIIVSLFDVTECKQKEKEIAHMANYDALTGLPNRWLFNDHLKFAIAHAKRNQERLALVSFDLDNFEQANSTLGYKKGDRLLQKIVDRIGATMRESDILARMGGDEFALILGGIVWVEDAMIVIRRILDAIQNPCTLDGHTFHVTASAGVAVFPTDGKNSDTLFKHAEIAMYRAKTSGIGQCQRYTPAMVSKSKIYHTSEQKFIVSDARDLRYGITTLERAIKNTIVALSRIIEAKDPYTAGHQRRVAKLACAIARKIRLPEETISSIRIASMIHDIGKVYIPGEILSKPGKLIESEFNMIKMHCELSCDIIKDLGFPWQVSQIILQHHERMDGSGYPQKLTGEDILLEAKILAVADVVDAMFSHRPYRPALGIEKALDEVSKSKAVLYDANVVNCCLELFSKENFQFE